MAALDRVVAALEARGCHPRRSANGYTALCPVHEADGGKHKPSLGISQGDKQAVVFKCGADCSVESILDALFLTWADVCEDQPQERKLERPKYVAPPTLADDVDRWCAALDLAPERMEWLVSQRGLDPLTLLKAKIGWDGERYTIPIYAQHGALLRVKRYLPDGEPKYLEPSGSQTAIYGAETLAGLEPGNIVLVCEGEIGALACRAKGFVAISATGGAGSWKPEWGALLEPYDVVAVGDNDPPGAKFASAVVRSVEAAGGVATALVWPRGTPPKTDPADWFGHLGRDRSSFGTLALAGTLRVIEPYEALTGEPEPIPWIVPGWFSQSERIIIAGEWSTGKSTVALELAISLATGSRFMGLLPIQSGPYRVLYVDEENGTALAKKRMRQLMLAKGISSEQAKAMPLRYLSKNGLSFSTDRGQAAFRRDVERFRPDVIVLDSVIRFFDGDNENDNSQWSRFITKHVMPYNSQGIAFIILDHVRKPANGKGSNDTDVGQRIRGASDKPGSVDELWCITGDRHTNKRTMTHERTRWDEYQPALQLSWRTSDDKSEAWLEAQPEKQGCEELILSHVTRTNGDGALRLDVQQSVLAAGFQQRAFEKALTSLHVKGQIVKAQEAGRRIRIWARIYAPESAA